MSSLKNSVGSPIFQCCFLEAQGKDPDEGLIDAEKIELLRVEYGKAPRIRSGLGYRWAGTFVDKIYPTDQTIVDLRQLAEEVVRIIQEHPKTLPERGRELEARIVSDPKFQHFSRAGHAGGVGWSDTRKVGLTAEELLEFYEHLRQLI